MTVLFFFFTMLLVPNLMVNFHILDGDGKTITHTNIIVIKERSVNSDSQRDHTVAVATVANEISPFFNANYAKLSNYGKKITAR